MSTLGFRAATPEAVAGKINLVVRPHGDKTVPVKTDGSGVLRLMRPHYLDDSGQATYILINPGGAYFGEEYRIRVELEPGAHLLLTNQGATRIYKTPKEPAVQEAEFILGAASRLEYLPDQVIAYKNATYIQKTKIEVAPDAQLFSGEIITPGWDPEGIKFTYSTLHLRTEVRAGDTDNLSLVDNVRVRPQTSGKLLEDIGYLEGYSHMGSAVVVGPHADEEFAQEALRITGQYSSLRAGVARGSRYGVSWVIVRALGNSTGELNDLILDLNQADRDRSTGQGRANLRRF